MEKAKPLMQERFKDLLGSEYNTFCKVVNEYPVNSLRVNTLKISVDELKSILSKKWKIKQPYIKNPEIFVIESKLEPGEIGKAEEHLLGYYYVQEIASMMPIIALDLKENDIFLDLCAAPGSKTTQAAMMMNNIGTIIANDANFGRMHILSTNIQRMAVTNTIVTHMDGNVLCKRLHEKKFKFDKILVDAPCSGEGTIRSNQQAISMFSEKAIISLSKLQKGLVKNAISVLKKNGEFIYSTCTHAPEENEAVVSYILEKFPVEIMDIEIPLKTRPGIKEWKGNTFHKDVIKSARIYPQDNNTEGFFIAKFKLLEELE